MPQPPHGPGYSGQHPAGPPPQGPPSGPLPSAPPGVPGAPTQQFQTGPGGQWNPAGPPKPSRPPMPKVISAVWVLGLISVAATIVGLSVNENGVNAWHAVNAWGGLAIAGALLTLAPAVAGSMNMTPQRAWQVAVCGAGALLLFWVLFVLPAVGSNTSLVVTIGVAAGVIAAWIAPGRDTGTAPGGGQDGW
ncbi:MAG: hypothetical protein QOJ34_940 [Pseudonocardiales bacterium]|nr:hypothetical protein [Pseudonocardiales bacterium]